MSIVSLNLFKAGIAIVFLLLVDFISEFFIVKNIKEKKKSAKLRVATRYILFFCFVFFMAKIWVEGFGYLLTTIGVIAAALTITQKEYLMNLIGWLIIMWRDFFVEGDYIEIGKYNGYVKSIRPLYFSLEEASDLSWGDKTGRIFKIPNSYIATNSILKYAQDKSFVEGKLVFTFTFDSSLEKIQNLMVELENSIEKLVADQFEANTAKDKMEYNQLKKLTLTQPKCSLKIFQENPSGIMLKVRYLSLKSTQKIVEPLAFKVVMNAVKKYPEALKLAVVI